MATPRPPHKSLDKHSTSRPGPEEVLEQTLYTTHMEEAAAETLPKVQTPRNIKYDARTILLRNHYYTKKEKRIMKNLAILNKRGKQKLGSIIKEY